MTRNHLSDETSPYLLQHCDNPVHWYPWGDAAFDRARAENRPVLLSIGYAACHWCHVMAHESFEDEAIAAQMNDGFINVKVDREERPDVDAIYQQALAFMGQQGGWPLTMLLTPDRDPFWGGTYFPPEPRYGRGGFPQILARISQLWRDEPEVWQDNRDKLSEALKAASLADKRGAFDPKLLTPIAARIHEFMDRDRGGTKGAPKFPETPIHETLWRAAIREDNSEYADAVAHSLTHMALGGIYDHVGGGFARYSVDDLWLVPHFEKMLYDNAMITGLMLEVWRETKSPLFAARIEQTIEWVLRELRLDGGGFAASLDADSADGEGYFYTWTIPELQELLGANADAFISVYGVTESGNFEGRNIPNRLHVAGQGHKTVLADEVPLAEARAKLLAERNTRDRPGLDDKILVDWNGLMITALARTAVAFDRPDWLEAAERAYRFISAECRDKKGVLLHSWCKGKAAHPALLEDYANLSEAALTLAEATGDVSYLDDAVNHVDTIERLFLSAAGGYHASPSNLDDLILRKRDAMDSATPNGNGTLLTVLAQLWRLTGEARFEERARALSEGFAADLPTRFPGMGALLNGIDTLQHGTEVVIVGDRKADDTRRLLALLEEISLPGRTLQVVGAPDALPEGHPAAGKAVIDNKATAYVCRGQTCSAPVTEPDDLARMLRYDRPL